MVEFKRQSFRHLKANFGCVLALSLLLVVSLSYANTPVCETSHLSLPPQYLEQIASHLAGLRLQNYKIKSSPGEKWRVDQEFRAKYSEFESLVGDKTKAKEIFMSQMKLASALVTGRENQQAEQKEERERERQLEAIDPVRNPHKMKFHQIRPGKFLMGQQKVETEITKPFAMMETTVTQMMWAKIAAAAGKKLLRELNPSDNIEGEDSHSVDLNGSIFKIKPNYPAESFTLHEAWDWIGNLNSLSRSKDPKIQALLKELIPDHEAGDVYDLPTEAQWEFVMRNRGDATGLYFDRDDSTEISNYAWFANNEGFRTHAVATLQPRIIDGHPFYDLEGNVNEWMKDSFKQELKGGRDPINLEWSRSYSIRGGCVGSFETDMHTNHRSAGRPEDAFRTRGMRLVRTRP